MSTYALIGGYIAKDSLTFSFVVNDGYPEGVGKTLHDNWMKWGYDTNRIITYITQYRWWEVIQGSDFNFQPVEYYDNETTSEKCLAPIYITEESDTEATLQQSYKITDDLSADDIIRMLALLHTVEYVYVFNPYDKTLTCYDYFGDIEYIIAENAVDTL